MFYKFFMTTFLILFIQTMIRTRPEWKNNRTRTRVAVHCVIFMLIQSVVIASAVLIIYNMWK